MICCAVGIWLITDLKREKNKVALSRIVLSSRERLIALGRAGAQRFDWTTSAEALGAAYRAVADA